MSMTPPAFRIGDIAVQRVIEWRGPFLTPFQMWPEDATEEAVAAARPRLEPWAFDPESGKCMLTVQAYLLRTAKHTILIDTCVGCGKSYERIPFWHKRTDRVWLDRLAATGVSRESVDYVLCTHLHGDHCGWNTMEENGRWVPTFPNARYVMSREEITYIEAARPSTYAESVSPVLEAGLAQVVDQDFSLDDEVWLERMPGHTLAHAAVNIRSNGAEAVMIGDAIHNPIQLQHPDWRFFSDVDPALAATTRRAMLEANCERDRLVMSAHFPGTSVGNVTREGALYGFRFREGC